MKKQRVNMWVDPAFRKAAKKKAIDCGMGLEDYTRKLADDLEKQKEKKKDFRFL